MRSIVFVAALLAACVSIGCARHGVAGEACSAPGLPADAYGQCAAGFVCAPDHSGLVGNGQSPHWLTTTCRPACLGPTDCTTPHTSCRAVPGAEYVMACLAD